jgi:hypothetical protein
MIRNTELKETSYSPGSVALAWALKVVDGPYQNLLLICSKDVRSNQSFIGVGFLEAGNLKLNF